MSTKRPWFRRRRGKGRGQSLVEFTVLLPVLLIMISGLIEFGFMLNYYLDLIDAAREAARWASNADPIRNPNTGDYLDPNNAFYTDVQTLAKEALLAASDDRIDWIDHDLDSMDDDDDSCIVTINGGNDIVISAFGIRNNEGSPVVDRRFPVSYGEAGVSLCNNRVSEFTSAEIQARLDPAAPTSGLVMVEIFYDYHMVLALPWITAFVPNPIPLHAYTIMPNANVEPTPTP